MNVNFLAKMIKRDAHIRIVDNDTKKTIWNGKAADAEIFQDKVIDWDFSKEMIIYI